MCRQCHKNTFPTASYSEGDDLSLTNDNRIVQHLSYVPTRWSDDLSAATTRLAGERSTEK